MASPFQKYQSGIEASTGNLVSAYGQMAQQTSASFANLGNTLAEGIKTYAKNRDENELLTAKAQGLAGNFEFLTKQIKDNPELAPFAESFNPILNKIGKFETMSKGQKQALLLEAETFQAQIAPALAMFKEGNVARTRQGVQSALDAKPKIKTAMGVEVEALPYQPDKDADWNVQNNREYIELTKKNDPKLASLDVEGSLKQIVDGWSTAFSADPNLAKTDPKFRDTILRGLSDWKSSFGADTNPDPFSDAYTGATVSPVEMRMRDVTAEKLAAEKAKVNAKTTSPTTPTAVQKEYLTAEQKYNKEFKTRTKAVENADAGVEKATAATKAFLDAREGKGSMSDSEGKQYSWLLKQEEKAQKAKEKADNDIESLDKKSFKSDDVPPLTREQEEVLAAKNLTEEDKFKALVTAKTDTYEKRYLEELLADVKSGGYVGIMDRLSQHTMGNERLLREVQSDPDIQRQGYPVIPLPKGRENDTRNFATPRATPAATAEALEIASKRRGDLVDWIGKLRATQGLGMFDEGSDIRPAKKLAVMRMIEERIAGLDKSIKNPTPVKETTPAEARAKAESIATGATTTATPTAPKPTYEETLKRPFDYSTKIKSDVKFERDMTYAEEKEYVRKWFVQNRGGVIPESLDAVYKAVRPETDVQFMPAPDGGQVMITSKGAQYIPPVKPEKGMSDKEKSEVTLYNYGVRDGNRLIPEERTRGSGIKLAGFAKGGEENAKNFQKLHDDTVKARTIIPKLLAMYKKDKLGRTLIPNEMWGDAESLLAQLKAAIRVETVGTGPVALPEHQMILERIGDPRKFFALDTVGKSKLNSIMTSMENSLRNNNAGIQVTFTPTAGDSAAMERQARIDANKSRR